VGKVGGDCLIKEIFEVGGRGNVGVRLIDTSSGLSVASSCHGTIKLNEHEASNRLRDLAGLIMGRTSLTGRVFKSMCPSLYWKVRRRMLGADEKAIMEDS
jgi:hypothetical protein